MSFLAPVCSKFCSITILHTKSSFINLPFYTSKILNRKHNRIKVQAKLLFSDQIFIMSWNVGEDFAFYFFNLITNGASQVRKRFTLFFSWTVIWTIEKQFESRFLFIQIQKNDLLLWRCEWRPKFRSRKKLLRWGRFEECLEGVGNL